MDDHRSMTEKRIHSQLSHLTFDLTSGFLAFKTFGLFQIDMVQ